MGVPFASTETVRRGARAASTAIEPTQPAGALAIAAMETSHGSAGRAGPRGFTTLSGALYPRKLLLCSNKHGASRKFVTLIGLHNPADAHFAAILVASRYRSMGAINGISVHNPPEGILEWLGT